MVAEQQVSEFSPTVELQMSPSAQNLANTAWAFATDEQPDEKLSMAMARAAERRMSDLNTQNLANMGWSCAALNLSDEKLFVKLAGSAEQQSREFNA